LWTVNNSGVYVMDTYYPIGSQTSDLIDDIEVIFDFDHNNDLHVGGVPDSIESEGDVALVIVGDRYRLDTSEEEVWLTRDDKAYGPDTVSQWGAIHAEENGAGGFDVLWERINGDYAKWSVDGTGAYQSDIYMPVGSLSDTDVWELETTFEADLDGDLLIGEPIP